MNLTAGDSRVIYKFAIQVLKSVKIYPYVLKTTYKRGTNMKKAFTIVSLSFQGLHTFVCLLQITLCLIYKNTDNASITDGLFSAMIFLLLPIIFTLVPLLVSLILNVVKTVLCFIDKSPRRILWLIWVFISPILYIICFWLAAGLFVYVTGGV